MTKGNTISSIVAILLMVSSGVGTAYAGSASDLHSSIRQFSELRLLWETENYLVRVDDMGNMSFRYAVWPAGSSQSDEPDLVLYGGTVERDGSGGNHYYEFTNNEYSYKCYVVRIGTGEEPPGYLIVYRNGSEILRADVVNMTFSYWNEN